MEFGFSSVIVGFLLSHYKSVQQLSMTLASPYCVEEGLYSLSGSILWSSTNSSHSLVDHSMFDYVRDLGHYSTVGKKMKPICSINTSIPRKHRCYY